MKEELSLTDYLFLPWQLLKYAYAWVVWRITIVIRRIRLKWKIRLPIIGGRHVDPDPVRCEECNWMGMRRWTVHTYGDDGTSMDVEPVDECPRCGAEI